MNHSEIFIFLGRFRSLHLKTIGGILFDEMISQVYWRNVFVKVGHIYYNLFHEWFSGLALSEAVVWGART